MMTEAEIRALAKDCILAAECMEETGTFETGQGILRDAARLALSLMDQLADAQAAQAALVERAGEEAEHAWENGYNAEDHIRALAPDAGVKDLAALRLRASAARWNVDEVGRLVRLCRGDHEKGENCEDHDEVFVPIADRDRLAAELAEARKQVEALRGALAAAEEGK